MTDKKQQPGPSSHESRPISTREADRILKEAAEREGKNLRITEGQRRWANGERRKQS